jgi:hypothetical protein
LPFSNIKIFANENGESEEETSESEEEEFNK